MITPLVFALLFGADPRVEADRLVEEGAALGTRGLWDDAIERFEAADALFPRAIHACNIGLAHARANRPEHALLKLTACQARAVEALPSWVDKRVAEARDILSRGDYVALELVAERGTEVTIGHFAKTSFFPPVTVWLPFGTHQLHATAPGRLPLDDTLTLSTKGRVRRIVELAPLPQSDPIKPAPDPLKPDPEPAPRTITRPVSRASAWITLTAGGALLVTGTIFNFVARDSFDDAEKLNGAAFEARNQDFEIQRGLSYGFFIAGGLAAATGLALLVVLPSEEIVIVPAPNGVSAYLRF